MGHPNFFAKKIDPFELQGKISIVENSKTKKDIKAGTKDLMDYLGITGVLRPEQALQLAHGEMSRVMGIKSGADDARFVSLAPEDRDLLSGIIKGLDEQRQEDIRREKSFMQQRDAEEGPLFIPNPIKEWGKDDPETYEAAKELIYGYNLVGHYNYLGQKEKGDELQLAFMQKLAGLKLGQLSELEKARKIQAIKISEPFKDFWEWQQQTKTDIGTEAYTQRADKRSELAKELVKERAEEYTKKRAADIDYQRLLTKIAKETTLDPELRAVRLEDKASEMMLGKQLSSIEQLAKSKAATKTAVTKAAVPIVAGATAAGFGAAFGGAERVGSAAVHAPGAIASTLYRPVGATAHTVKKVAGAPGRLAKGAAKQVGGTIGFAGREAGDALSAFGHAFGSASGSAFRELPAAIERAFGPKHRGEIYDLQLPFLQQYSQSPTLQFSGGLGGIDVPPGRERFDQRIWGGQSL